MEGPQVADDGEAEQVEAHHRVHLDDDPQIIDSLELIFEIIVTVPIEVFLIVNVLHGRIFYCFHEAIEQDNCYEFKQGIE